MVSITVSPVKDHKGNIIGASKVARDITQQVRSQEALKRYSKNLEILNSTGKFIAENLEVEKILQQVINITTQLTQSDLGFFYYDAENSEGKKTIHFAVSGASQKEIAQLKISGFKDLIPGKEKPKKIFNINRIEDLEEDNAVYRSLKKDFGLESFLVVPVVSKSGKAIGILLFGNKNKSHFDSEHELMVANIAGQAAISLQNSRLFEKVKALSQKKDEFIALASHELKTPLTTVKGYLQLLMKMNHDSQMAPFFEKTLHQVERVNNLIEDLLNISRMERGKLEFKMNEFDLREMLKEICSTFSYSSKSHKIICDIGNQPVKVKGDPHRIEQVVINLLSNAVKYSPHANKVGLKLQEDENKVRIMVEDYGLGIEKQQQKQLFQRFFRADNSKGIHGLGIGLYLSKQIVDRHNGQIEVLSECGKGSIFTISLPKTNSLKTNTKSVLQKEI